MAITANALKCTFYIPGRKKMGDQNTILTTSSAWPHLVLIVSSEVLKLSEGDPSDEVPTDVGPILKYGYSALKRRSRIRNFYPGSAAV